MTRLSRWLMKIAGQNDEELVPRTDLEQGLAAIVASRGGGGGGLSIPILYVGQSGSFLYFFSDQECTTLVTETADAAAAYIADNPMVIAKNLGEIWEVPYESVVFTTMVGAADRVYAANSGFEVYFWKDEESQDVPPVDPGK